MHVLVCTAGSDPALGGGGAMAWYTAQALAARGHRVRLAGPGAGPPPTSRVEGLALTPAGLAVAERPDVVHAFDAAQPWALELAAAAARDFDVPLAVTPCTARDLWPDPGAVGFCRDADVVYVLNPAERRGFVDAGVDEGRLVTVGQGAAFDAAPGESDAPPLPPLGGFVTTFLGRRVAEKGYGALLDAMPQLWRAVPGATLLLLGPTGPEPPVHPDDRIVDLGLVDAATKRAALAASDVLCIPTTVDIFPLAFVEAWSCGIPVVSGDFPGARSVVRHGVDGLVVPARPDELAAALAGLATDPDRRRQMGAAGRSRVRAELTWDVVAAQVEHGYRTRCDRYRPAESERTTR